MAQDNERGFSSLNQNPDDPKRTRGTDDDTTGGSVGTS
jgi:hypothetical protein